MFVVTESEADKEDDELDAKDAVAHRLKQDIVRASTD